MQHALESPPKSTEPSHTLPAHVPALSLIAGVVHERLFAAALHSCLATQEPSSRTNPSLHAPQVIEPAEHVCLLALEHAVLASALHTLSMQQALEKSPKSTASHILPAQMPALSLIADDAHARSPAVALHDCLATQESFPSATYPSLHSPHVAVPAVHASLLDVEHVVLAASSHLSTQTLLLSNLNPVRQPPQSVDPALQADFFKVVHDVFASLSHLSTHTSSIFLNPVLQLPQVSVPALHTSLLAVEHVVLTASSHLSTQSSPSGLNPVLHAPQAMEFIPSVHASFFALEQVALTSLSHTSTQEAPSSLKPVKQPPQVSAPAEHASLLALEQSVFAPSSHLSTHRSPSGLKPAKQPPQASEPAEHAPLLASKHLLFSTVSQTSTQRPPSGLKPTTQFSQLSPSAPVGQSQVYSAIPSMHSAPFSQGSVSHSSTSSINLTQPLPSQPLIGIEISLVGRLSEGLKPFFKLSETIIALIKFPSSNRFNLHKHL